MKHKKYNARECKPGIKCKTAIKKNRIKWREKNSNQAKNRQNFIRKLLRGNV